MSGLSIETLPRWVVVMLGLMLLLAAAAEVFLTWLLTEHVPWLGWPLTVLTVAGVAYAVVRRMRRKAKPGGSPPA